MFVVITSHNRLLDAPIKTVVVVVVVIIVVAAIFAIFGLCLESNPNFGFHDKRFIRFMLYPSMTYKIFTDQFLRDFI